jgi:hypothetical protein
MADEEVKIFDESEKEILASNKAGICFFCLKNFSKYTCPRCNVAYCSVSCYNSEKHLHCSEGFFKENVLGELSQRSKDPEDVQNILRMLKNLEDEAVAEEEKPEEPSLEDRLSNINLDSAEPNVIWDSLTEEEKREFESSLKSGYLSEIIEEWIPWWHPSDIQRYSDFFGCWGGEGRGANMGSKINLILTLQLDMILFISSLLRKVDIQVLKSEESKNEGTEKQTHDNTNISKPCPKHYPRILHKVQQLSVPTSPLLKYSIVDFIYAYAYTMRLYNGSPMENPDQSSQTLYTLSASLSKGMTFDKLESVVHNSFNVVLESKDLFNSLGFSYGILLDVIYLTEGSFKQGKKVITFIECALSDAHRIIEKGRKALKNDTESCEEDIKRLWLAKKKVEFFLSWLQSNSDTIYSLAPHLRLLHFELMSNCEVHEVEKRKLQTKWKGRKPPSSKKLIEEI